ncbi:hypothetical protein V1478_018074, partial [Vespula squamosa]
MYLLNIYCEKKEEKKNSSSNSSSSSTRPGKSLHRAAVYNEPLTLWCYAADGRVARCPVTPMSACYPDRPIVICNYPKTAP